VATGLGCQPADTAVACGRLKDLAHLDAANHHAPKVKGASKMDPSPNTPEDEPPKWRGRVEVLLLVAGGLVLLIPTLAIFLAGGE
jgi:hypothetical protein